MEAPQHQATGNNLKQKNGTRIPSIKSREAFGEAFKAQDDAIKFPYAS
jgi:hypothetical protein